MTSLPKSWDKAGIRKSDITLSSNKSMRFEFLKLGGRTPPDTGLSLVEPYCAGIKVSIVLLWQEKWLIHGRKYRSPYLIKTQPKSQNAPQLGLLLSLNL